MYSLNAKGQYDPGTAPHRELAISPMNMLSSLHQDHSGGRDEELALKEHGSCVISARDKSVL